MISPIEIRKQTFGKSLRGYDTEEVKAFLQSLSNEWEKVLEDNRRLKSSLDVAEQSLVQYKEMEDILRKTLLQAEQSSKIAIENAKREAQAAIDAAQKDANFKIQEAEQKANDILAKAYEDRARIDAEITDVLHRRNELTQHIRMFLTNLMDRVATFEQTEGVRPARTSGPAASPADTPRPAPQAPENAPVSMSVNAPASLTPPDTEQSGPIQQIAGADQSFFDKAFLHNERSSFINDLIQDL